MTEALQALIADWDRVGCAKAKEAEDAWVVGYRRGKKIAAQELRAALATPAPAQPEGQSADVDEMAAWMRRLVRALRKAAPGNALAEKALDDLKRRGLLGDVLREAEEPDPLHVANERGEGEDARDAARYRFLRASDGLDEEIAGLNQCHWDKVIDAAMAAAPKETP